MTTPTTRWTTLAGLLLALSPAVTHASQEPAAAAPAQEAPQLKDDKAKASYAVGMNLGSAIRRQSADRSADLDGNLIVQGFKDAFAGSKTLLTDVEMRTILTRLQADLKTRQAAHLEEKAAKARSDEGAFLASNKAREDVVTMESGLQYKILKGGDGKKPTIDDTVVCHYRGTLIDGTEFDSSYTRNKPATFPLKRVIRGWTEALQMMPVGSKWQLFIPSSLAYGERGSGKSVPPNATLIFEVELLSVQDSAAAKTDGAEQLIAGIVPAAASASHGITLSFKLDPRLSKGLYMGDRWVSLPYSQVGEHTQVTVEARAEGVDHKGKPTSMSPKWVSADPEVVTVTPYQGNAVKITARRPGESSLRVTSGEFSRVLAFKAAYKGDALVVEISEKQ